MTGVDEGAREGGVFGILIWRRGEVATVFEVNTDRSAANRSSYNAILDETTTSLPFAHTMVSGL